MFCLLDERNNDCYSLDVFLTEWREEKGEDWFREWAMDLVPMWVPHDAEVRKAVDGYHVWGEFAISV